MSVFVITDPLFLEHDPGPGHPESPARLRAILGELEQNPVPGTEWKRPRPATAAEIAAVHDGGYADRLAALAGRSANLDADTSVSPRSHEAAVLAAGAAVGAVEAVFGGAVDEIGFHPDGAAHRGAGRLRAIAGRASGRRSGRCRRRADRGLWRCRRRRRCRPEGASCGRPTTSTPAIPANTKRAWRPNEG